MWAVCFVFHKILYLFKKIKEKNNIFFRCDTMKSSRNFTDATEELANSIFMTEDETKV
jgi:hypothetical protein